MSNKTAELRIAEALFGTNSPGYTARAGSTLTELSNFAEEGDLQNMSKLFNLYRGLVPADERRVRKAIPVKILNRYFCRARHSSTQAIGRWAEGRPGWRREVEDALGDPVTFERKVKGMADEIRMAEAV